MSDVNEAFFTSIGCMDGRVQEPVAEFGRSKFGAEFPDTITEAGLVGILSSNDPVSSRLILESLKKKLQISEEKHHSRGIIVHGHQECAGNPVDDETQKKQIIKSAELIRKIVPNLPVIPVFVVRGAKDWEAKDL